MRPDVVVSDAEQQPSAYRIKRLCPAKMVPSVSAGEAERTGEAERKKGFSSSWQGFAPPKGLFLLLLRASAPPLPSFPLLLVWN